MSLFDEFLSIPFRSFELLATRRKKYGRYTIFYGVDNQGRDFGEFYKAIVSAIDLLPEETESDVYLVDQMPKKIIGTVFYTRIWSYPFLLQANYNRVFGADTAFVAGELLFEVLRNFFLKEEDEVNAIKKAKAIECQFVEATMGSEFDESKFLEYQSSRVVTDAQIRHFFKNFKS